MTNLTLPTTTIDLSQIDVETVNIECLGRASEIRIEENEARFNLWQRFFQSVSTYGIAGITIVSVSLVSCFVILSSDSAPDDKNWAQTTITSMATGVVGFLFGKQQEPLSDD